MTEKMYYAALSARQGEERTRCFRQGRVAICGLGGLGSNIALMLARSGVGELWLYDDDVVELSNIHRQQYHLSQVGRDKTESMKMLIAEVNPFCRVHAKKVRISETNVKELLTDADIICEAFDRPENKAMLVNAVLTLFPEKALVAASGMAGFGEANRIRTREIKENFVLCGDGESDVAMAGSLVASRVMICGGHQALSVLQLLERREKVEHGGSV